MEEIIQEKLRQWAKKETWYQLTISFLAVVIIVTFMTKQFKAIVDAMPSIQKFFTYISKKWFSQAIFRADVLSKLEVLQLQNNEIRSEVRFNGGSYKLVDAMRDMQHTQKALMNEVLYLRGLRDINDKFDPTFRFRWHPDKGVTFISESFLRSFGHHEGSVLEFNYEELVSPDDVRDMQLKWNNAANKITQFRDTQRVKDQFGNFIECKVMADPIKDVAGNLVEFVGIIETASL